MSHGHPTLHDCAASNCDQISTHMPVDRWKSIKAVLLAVVMAAVGLVAIVSGGDATAVGLATVVGVMVVTGVEVKEVEVAGLVSLTFRDKGRRPKRDDE